MKLENVEMLFGPMWSESMGPAELLMRFGQFEDVRSLAAALKEDPAVHTCIGYKRLAQLLLGVEAPAPG
jgi:hypothetical protein